MGALFTNTLPGTVPVLILFFTVVITLLRGLIIGVTYFEVIGAVWDVTGLYLVIKQAPSP